MCLLPEESHLDFFNSNLLQNLNFNRFKVMMTLMTGKTYSEEDRNADIVVKESSAPNSIKEIELGEETVEFSTEEDIRQLLRL